MQELIFTVDGAELRARPEPGASALDLLRDQLGVTCAKRACGQGSCGACTAIIDGKARPTCTLDAEKLAGSSVLTTRGLDPAEAALYTRAFSEAGGFQCGFCTPGLVLRTKALLDRQPDPDRAAIVKALGPHVCRCTGWAGVIRAVRLAAELRSDHERAGSGGHDHRLGHSAPRYQDRALILGERSFVADHRLPDMLHGALVWVPQPRCRLLSIDATKALALPGVHAVVTADDVPGEPWQGLLRKDRAPLLPVGSESACVGDPVAAVAAETRALARRAAALVKVEVEILEPVFELEQASQDPTMVLGRSTIERGDTASALAGSAVVIRERFRTQRVDHAFLEPEAALARPRPGGSLHLLSCGQGVFDDRRQLASFLAMEPESIEVELGGAGGAFGGREDLSVQPHACLLALVTGRPVLVELSMEESLRSHPKRHPLVLDYTLGFDQQGRITALEAEIVGDTGGHASVGEKVLERAAGHSGGPYHIPCARVHATTVLTHNPTSGAMRGFGANQAAFALEGCMERAAEALDIDPLELRLRNAARPGDRLVTGQIVGEDAGQVATLKAIRPHYQAARAAGRAVGLACGLKNVGLGNGYPEEGKALLEVVAAHRDRAIRVELHTGFTEMGQGHATVLIQAAAEITGLPPERFVARTTTARDVDVGMTTSSRATFLGGWGIKLAAESMRAALDEVDGALDALVGQRFVGLWQAPETHPPEAELDAPVIHWAYAWATQLAILDEDGRLERVVAAHDVGRALNPMACRGQIEGGVHMGAGYALSEELAVTGGWPDTRYRKLGILPAKHTPEVEVILVEVPATHGPWGAKGIGEVCLVPTAPAIAHAIHAFDGSWPTELPLRDSVAAKAMRRR
jgi:selenium-dependent xanthine dehydrogenase